MIQKWNLLYFEKYREDSGNWPILRPLPRGFEIPTEWISFNYVLTEKHPENKGVHFYIDDYQFERVWNNPEFYMEKLKPFRLVAAPDFSCYIDWPMKIREWNNYRRLAVASYWQNNGINVIPNVQWGDESTYHYCFRGIHRNCPVMVSSNGCYKNVENRAILYSGWLKMIEVLNPRPIVLYGVFPDWLPEKDRIIHIKHRLAPLHEKEKARIQAAKIDNLFS